MRVALVLFPGVSIDECEAFSLAFRHLAESGLGDCELVGVGAQRGEVIGPGGRAQVDVTFAEMGAPDTVPDVVLVPGGLGVDRTAHDEDLLAWLQLVEPTCQWIAASSTGTVVVAAAGLLGDHPAATHWLAGSKLAEFGSQASTERIVEVGHVLTCHGRISAMDVALLMILRLYNRETAAQVRAGLADVRPQAAEAPYGRMSRLISRVMGTLGQRGPRAPARPRNKQLDMSEWVEMELVANPAKRDAPARSPWDRPST